MAIPSSVTDILNSLQITGLPSSAKAGDVVAPQITPGLQAFDALGAGKVLAGLNLDLTNVVLSLTQVTPAETTLQVALHAVPGSTPPGAADVAVVVEQVELPAPAKSHAGDLDPAIAAAGGLPYLVPTGTAGALVPGSAVEGILGRMRGTVQQVEELAGTVSGAIAPVTSLLASLTGKITGAITDAQTLLAPPAISVNWQIEGQFALVQNTGLTSVQQPPVLVPLPEFTEATDGSIIPGEVRISCGVTVTVKVGVDSNGNAINETVSRTVGPFTVEVPKVQIPTLAAFTENSAGRANFPGSVLIGVPSSSAIISLNNLKERLAPVQSVLTNLETALQVADAAAAGRFGAAGDNVGTLINLLGATNVAFVRGDRVMDLSSVTRVPGGWLNIGYQSWEDVISAVLLVGPPQSKMTCHNRRNLWQGTGEFELKIGSSATGFIKDLSPAVGPSSPACVPSDSTFSVITAPTATSSPGSFNDVISSFQFLAPG